MYVLKINAGSFSFEAANPRHEHEYHLFERVKVLEGKVLCPGVITHASNIVEHPELIAERIMRFANLVGRENVMASADGVFLRDVDRLRVRRPGLRRCCGEDRGFQVPHGEPGAFWCDKAAAEELAHCERLH